MNNLRNYWDRFHRLRRRSGALVALNVAARKLLGVRVHAINDPIKHYQFISQPTFGPRVTPGTSTKTVLWFIPDFQVGSGGHLNIFRLIGHLDRLGFENSIVIVGDCHFTNPIRARECIVQHFAPIQGQVLIGTENLPPTRFAMATSWMTAYYVRAFQGAIDKGYFVQDFEPLFYPAGAEALLAENTYRFGFFGITAGGWLSEKLHRDYGMRTWPMGFSVDHEMYFPVPHIYSDPPTVFFYARPPTPRRAFELGVLALALVAKKVPNLKVVMAGWDLRGHKFSFDYVDCGVLSLQDLPDTYQRCRAALVISCTNLSLLPIEVMACGCPVVSNRGANVQWLLNDHNAVLVEPTVEDLASGLIGIISDQSFHKKVRAEGIRTARKASWQAEASKVAEFLNNHPQSAAV